RPRPRHRKGDPGKLIKSAFFLSVPPFSGYPWEMFCVGQDSNPDMGIVRIGILTHAKHPKKIPAASIPTRKENTMARSTRRDFLKTTLATAATITIAGTKSSGQVVGANDRIRIGVAGLNGRGGAHVPGFAGLPNVQVTYLIDPDTRTYAARLRQAQPNG